MYATCDPKYRNPFSLLEVLNALALYLVKSRFVLYTLQAFSSDKIYQSKF